MMKKNPVAVIDVGSRYIRAIVGERGVNKTFVIKADCSFEYDGFSEGVFFDVEGLKKILLRVGEFIKQSTRGTLYSVYVGAPGAFCTVTVKESQISFSKKKKITEDDVDTLFDAAFVMLRSDVTVINRSAVIYELDDCRRLSNPVGAVSETLKGTLSFILCKKSFTELFNEVLKEVGFATVECVSSSLAEAMYLVDAETRDRIAQVVDIGYISATYSLIQGDGIISQKSFDYGSGYISAALTDRLSVPFETAEELKNKVNLSRVLKEGLDVVSTSDGKYYNREEVKNVVFSSLDVLCENISEAIEETGYNIPEYVPLLITGDGITNIRGACEHIANRLNSAVAVVAPNVPMMDKPAEASALSLLNLALEQN